jgi:glycopeptide antibiotics resistance protein
MRRRSNSAPDRARLFSTRIRFGLWCAVILAATIPWTSLVDHTHWEKVQWVPFRSPPIKLFDVVVNVLLYVPFGYQFVRAFPTRARAWHVVALAGVLSFAIEASQLYSHSRFPSVQDLLCNVAGSWVGAITAITTVL